jgi:hypothetical protein
VLAGGGSVVQGMIRYTPNAGAFGCDLFSYEVALVEQEDDQRYPEVTRVMITIVSQNDPPSNPPDIFYYNPPYMRTLMPNTGEAEGLVRPATLCARSLASACLLCSP